MPSRTITVIGSTNVDMVMRLPKLPGMGETVTDGEFIQTFGGKGANQAVAAARAGGRVSFVACVGRDAPGDAMLTNFVIDGIDVRCVSRSSNTPSGAALVMFDSSGNNYLAVAPGANYCLLPSNVDAIESTVARSVMIVMQMEIPVDTTLRALELADRHGVPVLFNFAPVRTDEVKVSSLMTGLVVNEVEAEALCGCSVRTVEDAKIAGSILKERGPRFVIVTLGQSGAVVVDESGATHLPAPIVDAVDTTAAGDTFCGALAVALVEGNPLRDAAKFATVAAAISVTRAGAQPSIPHRNEINARLASVCL